MKIRTIAKPILYFTVLVALLWPMSVAFAQDCPPPSGGQPLVPVSWPAGTEIFYCIDNSSGQQMPSAGTGQGYLFKGNWWAVYNNDNGVWYLLNLPGMNTVNTDTTTANLPTINLPAPPSGGAPPWVFTLILGSTIAASVIIPGWEALKSKRKRALEVTVIGIALLILGSWLEKNFASSVWCVPFTPLCAPNQGAGLVGAVVSALTLPFITALIAGVSDEFYKISEHKVASGSKGDIENELQALRDKGISFKLGDTNSNNGKITQPYDVLEVHFPKDKSLIATWLVIATLLVWWSKTFMGFLLPGVAWLSQRPIGWQHAPWILLLAAWVVQLRETSRELEINPAVIIIYTAITVGLGVILAPWTPGLIGLGIFLLFMILLKRRSWNHGLGDASLFVALTIALLYSWGFTWLIWENPYITEWWTPLANLFK